MEHSDSGLFIKRERFEVLAILREICKQRTPLRVESQQQRFQSLLLSVGADNIVFSGDENQPTIDGEFTIVIESHDAKIEFAVGQPQMTEHQGVAACSTRLPQELVYIQRRRQFRITTPHWREFLCTGEYPDGTPYQLRIHDLSAGGVGLRFDGEVPAFLQPGLLLQKAQLDLGSYGSFKVNMELVVVNADREVDDHDQVVHFSRLSCRFLKLGLATERKIQSAVFAFELDFNKKKKR
ncbi:flagellar brake protein [Serratia ficaria]|uniref:Flagellar brake protein YcgR n=1 Tax=Serratia ficaria TaxID=61651 RepID=A0A240C2Z6_SERFI|nr:MULTISPECIES: flagellar brake protein [Serratia]MEE4482106.1 flagellar brake protein [Serratia ficaria]REF44613.1 c-di-GMP-binding flagellar brake protein YcgR [Serratia ficaria]CAI0713135.1 Cyclic di-GMP binding protein YcgR [Serratia ficaria]CAI0757498.1 Cyclic di-GMP binding protein YcgR [Serratia ficaria]CAI0793875.1 Cyclic di-GMP binding protein YcgR [Serratia ficaria]